MVSATAIRTLGRVLKGLRVLLLLSLPASACWTWLRWPKAVEPPEAFESVVATTSPSAALPDIHWYAPLWERDLKQRTVANVETKPKNSPPRAPLPALMATCIHGESRYAHLLESGGRTRMAGLGERWDRYQIVSIEPGRVELQDDESRVWVEIPKR